MTPAHDLGRPSLRCPVRLLQLQLDLQPSLVCSRPLGRQLLEGVTPVVSSLTLCPAVCCRVANMYFLFIAALQLIPGLSPTSWVTTVAPLCFVLFINGVKVGPPRLPSVTCCASESRPTWTPLQQAPPGGHCAQRSVGFCMLPCQQLGQLVDLACLADLNGLTWRVPIDRPPVTITFSAPHGMVSLQEIADDLGRHRSDAQINNAPAMVLRGREEVHTQWRHVQVGDVVKVWLLTQHPPSTCAASCSRVTWVGDTEGAARSSVVHSQALLPPAGSVAALPCWWRQ